MNDSIAVLEELVCMKICRHLEESVTEDFHILNPVKSIDSDLVIMDAVSNQIPSLLEHLHEIRLNRERVSSTSPEAFISNLDGVVIAHGFDDGGEPMLSGRNVLILDAAAQIRTFIYHVAY